MSGNSNYEVGYGKPPKHTRFGPGQSGNPKGRKKGARGLKTDLHAELVSRMTIQINGQAVTATKQQLMVKTLTARAAAGDIRAINALIDLVMQIFGADDRGKGAARLSPADEALLNQLLDERIEDTDRADCEADSEKAEGNG